MIKNTMSNDVEFEFDEEPEISKVIQLNKDIYLFGEINANTTGSFLAAFRQADSTPGLITVYICSSGGWVEGGTAMYDIIKSSKNKVKTVACATVCSSAILPYVAGDLRVTYPSVRFFLHEMSLGLGGETKLGIIKTVSNETSKLYKLYCEYVATETKLDKEFVEKLCYSDTYLSSDEALKLGFAHDIIPFNNKKYVGPTVNRVKSRRKK